MELKNFFAQTPSGPIIPSPTVYLYQPGTTTPATGLVDKNGAPLSNPFTGTVDGFVQFAAPDGDYDLRMTGAGRDSTLRVRFIDSTAASAEMLRDDLATSGAGKGADMVAFRKNSIASAVETTVDELMQQAPLTPAMFGDDLQAMFTAAMENSLAVYLPGKDYACPARISASGPRSISVLGDGPADTRLIFTGTTGGIHLIAAAGRENFTISDIGLYTNVAGLDDYPLWLESTSLAGRPIPGAHLRNVAISGTPEFSQTIRYWNRGIVVRNLPQVKMFGCYIYRYAGATGPVPVVGNAVEMRGNCTPGVKMVNCAVYNYDKALTNGPNPEDNTEGTDITGGEFVGVNYGVYLDYETYTTNKGAPDIRVQNCHISSRKGAVYGYNINTVNIFGLSCYRRSDAVGEYVDIHLKKCAGVFITNNEFAVGDGDASTKTAIKLEDVDSWTVLNNKVRSSSRDVGINIDAACTDGIERYNDFSGAAIERIDAVATRGEVQIQGKFTGAVTVLDLAPAPTIANNTDTVLSWNTNAAASYVGIPGSYVGSAPTRLTVPKGVSAVRLTYCINFAQDPDGFRFVGLRKNGVLIDEGGGECRIPATSSFATIVNGCSSVQQVVAGDYFELFVRHTAANDLTVQPGGSTWFEMQVVA